MKKRVAAKRRNSGKIRRVGKKKAVKNGRRVGRQNSAGEKRPVGRGTPEKEVPRVGIRSIKTKTVIYKFLKLPRAKIQEVNTLCIYNSYSGQLFYADNSYELVDGDIIETDYSYYEAGGNSPDQGVSVPVPDYSFTVDATVTTTYDTGPPSTDTYQDVMTYVPTADLNLAGANCNYPDITPTGDPNIGQPTGDPGYVEVDPNYFDDYDQYYDDGNDNPVYSGSACDSSIGIRG